MDANVNVMNGDAGTRDDRDAAARGRRRARAFAVAVLAAVATLLARGAAAVYHGLTDGFVSPIIFSPDSDTVIQNKLSLSRLVAEREAVVARIEESRAAMAAADSEIAVLRDIEETSSSRLAWANEIAGDQAVRSEADLDALRRERDVLQALVDRQAASVAELERSAAAGLVRKEEVERARNALDSARVELLKNAREEHAAARALRLASLARTALRSRGGRGLSTPDMVALREDLARTSVERIKAESERRSRAAQKRADEDALARLDELIAQMRKRPVFRAIDNSQTVAFVTYDELRRVSAGASVVRCTVWGFFGCRPVGTVAEVLPGEVAMQDSWGNAGRGQYAVLELSDPDAAQARSLRVRGGPAATAPRAAAAMASR